MTLEAPARPKCSGRHHRPPRLRGVVSAATAVSLVGAGRGDRGGLGEQFVRIEHQEIGPRITNPFG